MIKIIGQTTVELLEGDITRIATDAIVNAANEYLAHGGGVAGAIARSGGPVIQQESNRWVEQHGRVKTGTAAITSGGRLPARYVIHAVGPIMGSGAEDDKLKSATLSSLALADQYQLKSIAFPAISTGIFGYPMNRCAQVMLGAVAEYLAGQTGLERIVFCLWGAEALETFSLALANLKNS